MPASTDIFLITRNGQELLPALGWFDDHEVTAGICFSLNCDDPAGRFDILRVPFGGDGECCGECCGCTDETTSPECLGADDASCVCDDCLDRRLTQD